MLPDYYAILGIRSDASPEEVRTAYRRLARQHHPDVGGESAAFHSLQEAYDALSDPARRRAYDASLKPRALAVRIRMPAHPAAPEPLRAPEPLIPSPSQPPRPMWSAATPIGTLDDFERLFREFDEFFDRLEEQLLRPRRPSWRRND